MHVRGQYLQCVSWGVMVGWGMAASLGGDWRALREEERPEVQPATGAEISKNRNHVHRCTVRERAILMLKSAS